MRDLTLEEKGLLQVLEKVQSGEGSVALAVRFILLRRGLIDKADLSRLSDNGEEWLRVLRELNASTASAAD
jgi:hypothetical protein